jgi:hypothetical protein
MLLKLPPKLAGEILHKIVSGVESFATSQQSTSGAPIVPPAHGSVLAAQNFAKAHLKDFGWGLDQFSPLLSLWQGESGWNANAVNPGSGAYGIPQALGHGHPYNLGDYANQVMWGENYIKGTYGSPAAALSKWLSRSPHWYARGTDGAAAGWGVVGEQGPEFVKFHGGEKVLPHGMLPGYATGTEQLIRAEIQRDQVQLRVLENSLKYAGTALARAHYQAEIKVEQARIAVLNENLKKLLSAHVTAINKLGATQIRAFQNAGATISAAYAKITTATTPTTFTNNLNNFLKQIRLYFTPSVAAARSNLVISQTKQMQSLQAQIKTLTTNIANANAVQQQVLGSIQSRTGLTTIGIQGQGAAQGYNLLNSLRAQTATVNVFGASIRDLAKTRGSTPAMLQSVAMMDPLSGTTYARGMTRALNRLRTIKAPQAIINQLIAAGPEAANAYVDAITAAGPTVMHQIFAQAQALSNAQLAVSRGAASVVSGGGYNTGANFVAGLQAQQKRLNSLFAGLGRTMAQEAIRWFNVPANRRPHGFQHGGWINEPIHGTGLWSGSPYTFAENGRREYVLSSDDLRQRGHDGSFQGTAYHAHFDGLTGAAIESHVRTAFSAMSLTQGSLNRQGRRT